MTRFKALMCSIVCAGMVVVGLLPDSAQALHISQQEFVEEYRGHDLELVLMGAGLQRFTVMKMAAVGMYLPENIKKETLLEDGPRRVEIVFLQRMSRQEMHDFMKKHIAANWRAEASDDLSERLEAFLGILDETSVEERHAYTYIPGEGTIIEINGSTIATVPGEDFAHGLFSVYIGTKPADTRLKRKLMGSLDYHK